MATAIHVNGATVLKLRLRAPIADRAWVADLEALSDTPITGAVTITDGRNPWKGTALESGVVAGVCSVAIVGGAGGLRKVVGAKSYVGVIARSIVTDILAAAKESLARAALTAPELRTVLPHWTRYEGSAGEQLSSVLEAVGATWRVTPAGTVWVGSPSFLPATPAGLFELDREPSRRRVHVALDALDLTPDATIAGERVGDVELVTDDSGLRGTYWLEAA